MLRSQIKGLLFDKDGTLFDFTQTWGGWAQDFLRGLSGEDPIRLTALAKQIGFDVETSEFASYSAVIAGTPQDIAKQMAPMFPGTPIDTLVDKINTSAASASATEAVPLKPLLERFRCAGLKLGVATNDAEVPAHQHLSASGVLSMFDFVAGSDSGFGAKPEPGMQTAFCELMGLSPHQVAMVGDSAHDLLAGQRAGMTTIAVLTGVATSDQLSPLADVVLADIGGIPAYLGI